MRKGEFIIEISQVIANYRQTTDYTKCLILALENGDKKVVEELAKYGNIALESEIGNILITYGALGIKEALRMRQSVFVDTFSKVESLLHYYIGYDKYPASDIKNLREITSKTELYSFVTSINYFKDNYRFNGNQKLIDVLHRFEIAHDLRNCLMHNLGYVTKNRKLIKKEFGYTDGQELNPEHLDFNSLFHDLKSFNELFASNARD